MGNNVSTRGKSNHSGKRRRRQSGVPTGLVILLIAIAIAMGGLLGFAVARRTNPVDDRLQKANERIIELENTLNLIGFPMDQNPEEWIFDDSAQQNGAEDLAGPAADGGEDDLWSEDDGLLSGMLSEDADPVVVAEFDGGQLLSTEVIPEFNDQLTTQVFAGYSADEVSDSVLQSVLSDMAGKKLISIKAQAQGLDSFTDDELSVIHAQAQERYRSQLGYYAGLISQEDMSQEAINAAAEASMREAGITVESIEAEIKAEQIAKKVRDTLVQDVAVTDDEVQKHYQETLESQKASFSEYPEAFENAHNDGATLLYVPEGYRAVLNLLIPFESDADAEKADALFDQLQLLDPMNASDAKAMQEIEAQLDPLFAPLEAKAKEITDKLQNGERFDSLLSQYGADPLMTTEPLRSQGYYISDHTFLFSTEFIQGAMILETPGQVSSPLRSPSGLHLVEYLRNITPGEVPYEQVYDAMKAEALEAARDARYEERVAALLEEAHVKYYPERLQ